MLSKADSASSKSGLCALTTSSCGKYPMVAYFGLRMLPESGDSAPARILRSVVFPAPLEPTSPILSPLFITADTLSNIVLAPYESLNSLISIIKTSGAVRLKLKKLLKQKWAAY